MGHYIPGITDTPSITVVEPINQMSIQSKKDSAYEDYVNLCNLDIMENMLFHGRNVTRVPGGWIMDRVNGSVFVPYDDKECNNFNL